MTRPGFSRHRDALHKSPGIGMQWFVKDLPNIPGFNHLTAVHHGQSVGHSGDHPQIVSDQKQAHLEFFLDGCQQGQDLGLNRYVEGRGRLIGNNQTGTAHEAHGDHHALTQAPRKLVRILFQARSGRGNTHFFQQIDRPFPGLSGGYFLVLQDGFFQLVADGVAGIQGSHGFLEDHGHAPPPNVGHGRTVGRHQVLFLENQLIRPTNAPGRQEIHDGQGGHGFTAPGFTHQAQSFTVMHAETDVADRHADLSLPAACS